MHIVPIISTRRCSYYEYSLTVQVYHLYILYNVYLKELISILLILYCRGARKKDHAQVHHKHFTKSNQIATEHRYAHEYGDLSVNSSLNLTASVDKELVTPLTPKQDSGSARSTAALPKASQKASPKPPSQASQMKNKFEEALQSAGKPKEVDQTHTGLPNNKNLPCRSPSQSVEMKNRFEEALSKNNQLKSGNIASVSPSTVTASSVGRILKDEGVINHKR